MAKKNIGKKLLPIMLMITLSATVGVTGATILHSIQLENPIKTPPVEGDIQEDIDGNNKNAKFINKGEADVFLRVAYSETWIDADGNILPNTVDGESVAVPKWDKSSGDWDWSRQEKEGWVYYKHILPGSLSGKSSKATGYIVEDVNFDRVKELADTRYKTGKYRLHFTMEIVQASDDVEVSKKAVAQLFDKGIGNGWSSPETKYEYTIEWTDDHIDPNM